MNKKQENLKFGDFALKKRITKGYTLRKFCTIKGQDTAYISRIENNILPPPKNQEKLEALAKAYEIKKNTSDWVEFFDLAAASQLTIPQNVVDSNPNLVNFLPAFYRTARKKDVKSEDIVQLMRLIKGEVGHGQDTGRNKD